MTTKQPYKPFNSFRDFSRSNPAFGGHAMTRVSADQRRDIRLSMIRRSAMRLENTAPDVGEPMQRAAAQDSEVALELRERMQATTSRCFQGDGNSRRGRW